MWWQIVLGVLLLFVIVFLFMVVKLAVVEAKEETRDIDEAGKKRH